MDRNMELQSNNINTFIQHCIQKAKTKETPDLRSEEESISSMENNDDYQNSSLLYYQNDNTDHEPIEPDLIDEGLEIYHRQRNIELPIEHRYDEESTVYHADENSTLKNIRFSQEDDQQYSLNTDISSLDFYEYRTNVDTYSEADYLTNASTTFTNGCAGTKLHGNTSPTVESKHTRIRRPSVKLGFKDANLAAASSSVHVLAPCCCCFNFGNATLLKLYNFSMKDSFSFLPVAVLLGVPSDILCCFCVSSQS